MYNSFSIIERNMIFMIPMWINSLKGSMINNFVLKIEKNLTMAKFNS